LISSYRAGSLSNRSPHQAQCQPLKP
jgi:hypothetical protein